MAIGLDKAQILFQPEYRITDKIRLRHSTVGDILTLGEERYYQILSILTGIPSDAKSILWDAGYDWMEISDLEYFAMTVRSLSKEDTEIFLPGIDFSKFELYRRPDGDIVFSDKDDGITIDFLGHKQILDGLCTIHRIKKKVEKAGNKTTHDVLIEDDRERRKIAASNNKGFESSLIPMISAMVNREGFKYNYETVKEMRYGQFMDACARLQIIIATDQLVRGVYNGTVDSKKINKKQLDWTREI